MGTSHLTARISGGEDLRRWNFDMTLSVVSGLKFCDWLILPGRLNGRKISKCVTFSNTKIHPLKPSVNYPDIWKTNPAILGNILKDTEVCLWIPTTKTA